MALTLSVTISRSNQNRPISVKIVTETKRKILLKPNLWKSKCWKWKRKTSIWKIKSINSFINVKNSKKPWERQKKSTINNSNKTKNLSVSFIKPTSKRVMKKKWTQKITLTEKCTWITNRKKTFVPKTNPYRWKERKARYIILKIEMISRVMSIRQRRILDKNPRIPKAQ